MRARKAAWLEVRDRRWVVFDRSLSEDAEVFCSLHADENRLTEAARLRLVELAADLQADIPRPDMIVYVTGERATLRKRCRADRQPQFIQDSIERQVDLYRSWLLRRSEPVIVVDTSRSDAASVTQLLSGAQVAES